MRNDGGEVIFMPNSKLDDGEIILDESKTQSNLDFILSGGGGGSGVSWFEEISATDYIGEPPFSSTWYFNV